MHACMDVLAVFVYIPDKKNRAENTYRGRSLIAESVMGDYSDPVRDD